MDREKEMKGKLVEKEVEDLGKELRYTQGVVAGELAGWQEWRAKTERKALRDFVKGMVTSEKAKMDGLKRAMRKVRDGRVVATTRRDTTRFVAPVIIHLEDDPVPESLRVSAVDIAGDIAEAMRGGSSSSLG